MYRYEYGITDASGGFEVGSDLVAYVWDVAGWEDWVALGRDFKGVETARCRKVGSLI